ncbi:serine hydrolase domain-containing protein [Phaeacidiphilus oryzae]|jgi:CubicO group peptidase (beta-lactamase class C family)|uniref:serine hydrolase domain-containing protein n=1 Tax=Phaeacidiphilus oryzae TaxID=348818 RepID=UPI000569B18F|nr:serine hydrolase domain-containing protein [Phaeacidiphilus oryzae]
MAQAPEIHGTAAEGFEELRAVFAENFALRGERGAALALYRDGERVVDLWGGTADADAEEGAGRPWTGDTPVLLRSATKGVAATVLLLLAQRGRIDLDAPVAEYWPEFAARGKERVTVRQLLSHQAGVAALDRPLTAAEAADGVSGPAAVARQRPLWAPGETHGYHAQTFSWLLGELVRRVDGRTLGGVLAEDVTELLGLDLWIGLPEEAQPRAARIAEVAAPEPGPGALRMRPRREVAAAYADPGSLTRRAFGTVAPQPDENDPAWRAAELPGSNGLATARGLGGFYAALGAGHILERPMLRRAAAVHAEGTDRVLLTRTRFGLGFMLHGSACPMTSPGAFGHPGRGGSLAFADPETGLAFAYVTNGMQPSVTSDPRAQALVRAVRSAIARGAGARMAA